MRNENFWAWFDGEARPKLAMRAGTFGKMFEHLDRFDRPVTIIETGCARRDPLVDESWALDGCSTILFDRYVSERADGSGVLSVDLSPEAVAKATVHTTTNTVVICEDSVYWLEAISGEHSPDLLYLDSFDFEATDPIPSAIHHHRELMAALPMIRSDTLVAVDDSMVTLDDTGRVEVGGKGFLVARHMDLCAADFAFCNYQVGWTKVGPAKRRTDADLDELVYRARAHVEADDAVSAEHLYRLILGLTTPPKSGHARVAHGEACSFYAKLSLARLRLGAAADWYREALQADPLATDYRLELVTKCHMPMGNMRNALQEAERATRIAPDYNTAWHVLGGVCQEMGDAEKSIAAYDKEIELDPLDPNGLLDRATIAMDVADYDTVRKMTALVIANSPERTPDAIHCLAMVAYWEHDHEKAIELFQEAIDRGCRDAPMAHWNRSLSLHSIGRYKEAWVEHEQREFQKANPAMYLPMRRFTVPRWTGQSPRKEVIEKRMMIKGHPESLEDIIKYERASIHVHYEAGAGDNLCMVRYLPLLAERGYDVRFECAADMAELIAGSMPQIKVVPKALDYPGALGLQPFDYHVPIGSLPAVFGTDIDTIPWSGPYLKADPALVAKYRKALAGMSPAIGLCWSSGIREGIWMREYGLRKSMHFDQTHELVMAAIESDFQIVSLQVGPEREQAGLSPLLDVLPKKPTWSETAALMANLDVVVTVDTAVAHLAGAMGKKVFVMCQRDGLSWHFMCWRPGAPWNEASPWYPSARIFRQHTFDQPHQWDDVVADVARAIKEMTRTTELSAAARS